MSCHVQVQGLSRARQRAWDRADTALLPLTSAEYLLFIALMLTADP